MKPFGRLEILMHDRRATRTLNLVIILLLVLTLPGCKQASVSQTSLVRVRTLSAREFYPLAVKRARQWKSDAYLEWVTVGFRREEDSRHLSLSYGFESPGDDRYSLLITFREGSEEPQVENIYHQVPIEVRNSIDIDAWPLDSVDVLPIAQGNGGREFLVRHRSKSVVTYLDLKPELNVPGARLVWRAGYLDLVTRDSLDIIVDPLTGEILEIEEEGKDPQPDQSAMSVLSANL
jgi:hypothetical protein